MAEENINTNDGQKGTDGQGNESPARSENRIKDLADKLKEQEARHALEKEELAKLLGEKENEARESKFELELATQAGKYPHAKDFKNDIKAFTEKGLSVEEATKLVLLNNNKLVTGQDMQRARTDASSFGGSATTVSPTGEADPAKMTQEERRAALERLEQEGKFAKKGQGLYLDGNPVSIGSEES